MSAEEELSLPLKECRICFQTDYQLDILVNPCQCRGTMSFVHERCLVRWLTEKNINRCELCKQSIQILKVFTVRRLLELIKQDVTFIFARRDRVLRIAFKLACMVIYVQHFLPVVRFLRTKMLRNLCTLWMIFEQEEKMRNAYSFSWKMKAKQIIAKEIPITIKLMAFMWVLRQFVSFGAKLSLRILKFIYNRYLNAKEQRFIRNQDVPEMNSSFRQPMLQRNNLNRMGQHQIGDSLLL